MADSTEPPCCAACTAPPHHAVPKPRSLQQTFFTHGAHMVMLLAAAPGAAPNDERCAPHGRRARTAPGARQRRRHTPSGAARAPRPGAARAPATQTSRAQPPWSPACSPAGEAAGLRKQGCSYARSFAPQSDKVGFCHTADLSTKCLFTPTTQRANCNTADSISFAGTFLSPP